MSKKDTDKAVVAAINSMEFGTVSSNEEHLNATTSLKRVPRSREEIDKTVDELLAAGFFDNDADRAQAQEAGAREEKEFNDAIDRRLATGLITPPTAHIKHLTPNKRAQNEQDTKVLLTRICDEIDHVTNESKASSSKDADNNPSLNFNFKEEITMTTPENKTATTEAATPHVISTGVIDLSKRIQEIITIDATTGVASYGNMKFKDTLPENLPEEQVLASLAHMNTLAIAATHATGMAASKFIKDHPELKGVTGKFPGPNRGAHLDVSYKATTTMPSGDGTKVYHGTVLTAWKGVGGPGGHDYDAVKAAVRAAAEAEQAN